MHTTYVGALLSIGLMTQGAAAQSSASYFVTSRGGDTSSVEAFTRKGNTITGDWVTRQGGVLHHYVLTLGANGFPARYELTLSRLGPSPAFKQSHFVVTYGPDSATMVTEGDSVTHRVALKQGFPLLGTSVAGLDLAMAGLRGAHVDSGDVAVNFPSQAILPPATLTVKFLGGDSASIGGRLGNLMAQLDKGGHLLVVRAGPSEMRRVATLDMARFRKIFAAADSAELAIAAARKEITLPDTQLQRFVGEYSFGPNRTFVITRDGDRIFGKLGDQPSSQLFPESATTLFLKIANVEIEFEADGAGRFTALVLVQGGNRQRATRTGPGAVAQSPAAHPDVTGVWVMDTTKFQKNDPVLLALKLTVTSKGDTLVVVMDGTDARGQTATPFTVTSRYGFDGKPWQNPFAGGRAVLTSVLAWDGTTLVISSTASVNGTLVKMSERWTIDGTGKTMTRQQSSDFGSGERSQTLVFTRTQ